MQVDAELLALFVEVATFEAEGAGDVGHVKIVPADFAEQDFALEGFSAFQKCPLPRFRVASGACSFSAREYHPHFVGVDRIVPSEQHQSFNDVPQLAYVARPGLFSQPCDCVRRK